MEGVNVTDISSSSSYSSDEGFIFLQQSFAVLVQEIDENILNKSGNMLAAHFENDFPTTRDPITTQFRTETTNSTAYVILPENLFLNLTDSNTSRLAYFVFLTDSLFLRRNKNEKEVGSVILSINVAGLTSQINGLNDPPVVLNFVRNPVSSSKNNIM